MDYKRHSHWYPAITTRGMATQEMQQLVHLIDEALQNQNNQLRLQNIQQQTEKLCTKFPIYANNWHINNFSLSSPLQKYVE